MKRRNVWVVECRLEPRRNWARYEVYFTKREAIEKMKRESDIGQWRVVRYDASKLAQEPRKENK